MEDRVSSRLTRRSKVPAMAKVDEANSFRRTSVIGVRWLAGKAINSSRWR